MSVRNPRSYGAKGDGIRDDSRYVQRAIDAAMPGDVVSSTAKFTFAVKDLKMVNKNGVTICGLKLKDLGSTTATLLMQGCSYCYIKDNDFATPGGWAAIKSEGGDSNRRTGNVIHDGRTVGDKATRGMWLGNPGVPETNSIVEHNIVTRMNATGIGVMGAGAKILSNDISKINAGAGIVIAAHKDTPGGGVIAFNKLRDCAMQGIQSDCFTGFFTDGVTVFANMLMRMGKSAIYAVNARNWSILGNDVDGCEFGIVIDRARNVTATDNSIHHASQDGILCATDDLVEAVSLLNNHVADCKRFGFHVSQYGPGKVRHVSIDGNDISHCGRGRVVAAETKGQITEVLLGADTISDCPVAETISI